MEQSACRSVPQGAWWEDHNPDIFFPERGRLDDVDKARWSCFVCPVQIECGDFQRRSGSEYGMWAGKFPTKEVQNDTPWHVNWYLYLDLVPDRVSK